MCAGYAASSRAEGLGCGDGRQAGGDAELFPESVYENDFGTVGIKTESEDPRVKIIEVTTYRIEGKYTDKRHPDEVKFAKNIEDDLSRRDFTVNALAMDMKGDVIDPFGGERDIKERGSSARSARRRSDFPKTRCG